MTSGTTTGRLSGTVPQGTNKPKSGTYYQFFVCTQSGEELVWSHLSLSKAMDMNRATEKNFNVNRSTTEITSYGWTEMS